MKKVLIFAYRVLTFAGLYTLGGIYLFKHLPDNSLLLQAFITGALFNLLTTNVLKTKNQQL